jgi:hypothetical protein
LIIYKRRDKCNYSLSFTRAAIPLAIYTQNLNVLEIDMSSKKFADFPESKTPVSNPLFDEKNVFGAMTAQNEKTDSSAAVKKASLNRFIKVRHATKKILAATVFLAGCLALLFLPKTKINDAEEECKCENDLKTVNYRFPDLAAENQPPSWWEDLNKIDGQKFSIFKLSQDFPVELAQESCADGVRPWENLDFKTQSKAYMTEILKYAFAGNLEIDWHVEHNRVRNWVHAPWMHAGSYGREFIRGLTKERHVCREELMSIDEECSPDAPKYRSWAIAVYNSRSAYTVGKVWEEILKSEIPSAKNFPAEGFPVGSVSLKLIFTEAGAQVAPYLENSVEWLADTKRAKQSGVSAGECLTAGEPNSNCFDKLRLLQIDVAARDERSPTGWVFGAFTYHKDAAPIFDYPFPANLSQAERENLQRWLKLEFVGLMFGNDEGVRPGGALRETVINRQNPLTPRLGCGGRLNGIIDAPTASCFSCHAMAETPENLGIEPMPYLEMKCREDEMDKWFRSIDPRDADLTRRTFTRPDFQREIVSLDYSLQLREGIMRYCEENKQKCGANDNNR